MSEEMKTDGLEKETAGKNQKPKKSKWFYVAIVAGVLALVLIVFSVGGFFSGKMLLDRLFGKMTYVSEPEYEVPSSWDVDEDGIGPSDNLEDLISQLEKLEKEQAEKEQNKTSAAATE